MLATGALFGRFVCGFLCPFGWVQDLLYKIKTPKIKTFKGDRALRYFKYVVLVVMVILAAVADSKRRGNGDAVVFANGFARRVRCLQGSRCFR